jgi:hypothetical protein
MAVVVREAIQYDYRLLGSPEDKIFLVGLGSFQIVTYKTVAGIGEALDIFDSPWRP